MARTSILIWAISAVGCLLFALGLILALDAKVLGESTQMVGAGVALAGIIIVSLVRGLDVFRIGNDGFERE